MNTDDLAPKTLPKMCFIGGGNMANAIITGLHHCHYDLKNSVVIDTHIEKCAHYSNTFGMQTQTQIDGILRQVSVIILAVKPQSFAEVLPQVALNLQDLPTQPLIISIAAGIQMITLETILNKQSIIRAMPNTPLSVGLGATGLFANSKTSVQYRLWATQIFESSGLCHWLEEEALMSAIVALSGSGPAYFFLMMENMEKSAIALGLDETVARSFAIQTALGAATLAKHAHHDAIAPLSPAALRARVTSQKGTTEQAILSFQNNQFENTVLQAMQACQSRDQALSLALFEQIELLGKAKI